MPTQLATACGPRDRCAEDGAGAADEHGTRGGAAGGADGQLTGAECAARCEMLVGVIARTAEGGMGAKRTEWLASLLRRMLVPPEAEGKAPAALAREAAATERVCVQLVGQLIENLVQLEEKELAAVSPDAMARLAMSACGGPDACPRWT